MKLVRKSLTGLYCVGDDWRVVLEKVVGCVGDDWRVVLEKVVGCVGDDWRVVLEKVVGCVLEKMVGCVMGEWWWAVLGEVVVGCVGGGGGLCWRRWWVLWELSLRDVRMSDAGLYECQLTTHPPASLFFTLKVVEARAVVAGGPEVHVHTGVKLRLHCTVELATEPPDYIFWFHNDTMINYLPKRPLKVVNHHFASSLVISNVTWADAGSYRCEPHLATPANLTLHVVEGEKHAALHNGHSEGAEQDTTAAADSAHLSPLMVAAAASCLLIFASAGHLYTLDSDWS
ncbi:Carcinoembryonic antigen-related cell adhesion molecule 8-like [Homarus americanus]|uniref:Carcinoembryonic antigen-related cell adhesion molecule 8-like n=1 Tax=Homarus americanus TaxID=6706 RepID=A0A8J5JJJ7_HOMAM|nr:Carcinoembryonic antigen-related cell adhesion molecule 8-like [Homarus americanus]